MIIVELFASPTEKKTNEYNTGSVPEITAPQIEQKQSAGNGLWLAETGTATIYADQMAGRLTASSEPYEPEQLTAAHKTIPIGSLVRVTRLKSDDQVVVRINDRWGGGGDRVINLSKQAAVQLNFGSAGTAQVRLEVESFASRQAVSAARRSIQALPTRLEDTNEKKHSRGKVCQNEAEILGLSSDLLHNHVKMCLARAKP